MNVQQSKQIKITVLAAMLLFVALLLGMPSIALAHEDKTDGVVQEELENTDPDQPLIGETTKKLEDAEDDEGVEESGDGEELAEPKEESGDKLLVAMGAANGTNTTPVTEGEETPITGQAVVTKEVAETPSTTTATSTAAASAADSITVQAVNANVSNVGVKYRTHVQNDGWKGYVSNGQVSGTSGRSLRLEGIQIELTGMGSIKGSINYQVHVQNIGWQGAVANGKMSGTSGQSLRLEGIKIWLTGEVSNYFDVIYRTHVQNVGWQGWVSNGAMSGTSGRSLRLEGIQIALKPKVAEASSGVSAAAGVAYAGHVQNVGWQDWTSNGGTAGTSGRSLRVEALNMVLIPGKYSGSIVYQAHVQNIGWQGERRDGNTAGTSGESLRVEALRIHLTGSVANNYDVYYRTHVQNYGWMDWAKNGADSGSSGYSLRVEAVQIVLVEKGKAAPGATTYPTVNKIVSTRGPLDGIDISSWQAGINIRNVNADFVIVKATGGTGYTNPYWRSMAADTVNSGKMLGLYHFARESGCRGSATAEADYFVNEVKGYVGTAILVLDYEGEALDCGPGWAKTFLDRVYSRTGVKPLIYTSKSVTRSQDWSAVAPKYKLWVAQYPNYDTTGYKSDPWTDSYGYGAWSSPTMFQYASTGRISGYSGNLDLDKFYGSRDDWRKLAKKS